MNKILLTLAAAGIAFSAAADDTVNPDSTGFKFTDVKIVKTTPVRDQNKSGTCWCFSANTFLESEILNKTGKEVNLSEMFVVNHCYRDKAEKFIRMYGKLNFAQGGSIMDNVYVWRKYGMVPEEVYTGLNYGEDNHVHGELEAAAQGVVNAVVKNPNKKISTAWKNALAGVLDAYLGSLPETFVYEGKTYTPQSFAASLGLNMDDYVPVTSWTHHEFYKPCMVEVPDNWLCANSYNVPLADFEAIVDLSIEKGHAVSWAADVSERGFNWKNGFALIPAEVDESTLEGTELSRWVKLSEKERQNKRFEIKGPVKEITVTQELRQEMFDSQETTDDHGMVIVGTATDQEGNKYYKVQNSWTDKQVYGGFFYVSRAYFLAKTLNILVHKSAIPADVA
ncbi:MAG: aminopeptidase, partial [Muribaculaceae bacterium]|nr:aminopeptidase [Muribaculaceae bacterium]